MFEQKKLVVLSWAVLLALLMAAILPMSALAQDGVPPQPDVPVVVDPVVDKPVVEEPVVEEPTAVESAAEEPVVEEQPTVSEVLAEVPQGTEVVVLDEYGEALPLVSVEAATVVQTSDPMWCPSTAAKVTPDCLNDATVTGLLIKINNMTEAGVIYFMPTYTGSDASFNGDTLGTTANYDITFQGGWNGATTLNSVISFNNNTAFSNPFAVTSWKANVTVNNLTVTGVNTIEWAALYVGTTKDVVLNNVDVSYNVIDTDANKSYGAGAAVYTSGDVTVNNSRFNGNENGGKPGVLAGLWIGNLGNVTLNNVTANYNKGDGTDIWAAHNVNVSNSSFNFNTPNASSFLGDPWGNGLWIDEIKGDVTLNKVTAIGNAYNGVEVGSKSNDNKPGNGATGNIYVNDGYFEGNGFGNYNGDGLHLSANGNITLNDIYASGNNDDGAEVYSGGDVNINSNTYFDVKIRNANNVYMTYNPRYYNDWRDGRLRKFASFTAPMSVVIIPLAKDKLPGKLPEGKTFADAFEVKVSGGVPGEKAEVFFKAPEGFKEGDTLTVLSWNDPEWNEVPATIEDGQVKFKVGESGVFALVTP